MKKRILSIALVLLLMAGMIPATMLAADGSEQEDWQIALQDTQDYLLEKASKSGLSVGSTNGEWLAFGLLRNGVPADLPLFQDYELVVEEYVAQHGRNGRLDQNESTENSRVILALSALGKNVQDIGGQDLLEGLDAFSYLTFRFSDAVFGLIALDCRQYALQNVAREQLIHYVLEQELPAGGWASVKEQTYADDMTPMAIQALAPYYGSNQDIHSAIDRALQTMQEMSWNTAETCAQVVVALSAMEIDAYNDERYFQDGVSAVEKLLSFAAGNGGFFHSATGTKVNQMATEQAFYALVAYKRFVTGQTSLYDMSDLQEQETRFPVELLPYENGSVIVSKNQAAPGETVEITAEPAVGYELSGLMVNDKPLAFENNRGSFLMPEGIAIVEAVFSATKEGMQAVGDAMANFTVEDASEETLERMEDIIKAYRLLTAAQKLELRDAYYAFQEKTALFETYLKEAIAEAEEELTDSFVELDEDWYSEDVWEEIEELYDEAMEVLKKARCEEEVDELLEEYLEALAERSAGEVEVTFRLIGDWLHEDGTADHEEYVTWIETTEYRVPGKSTVYDLLLLALEDHDLRQKGAKKGYVEGVQAPDILGGYWLQEFDNGSNSGWMYTVNGDHPDLSLTEMELEDGDEVIWHYVDNFSAEERRETWLDAEDISPKIYVKRNLEQIVTIEGDGEVEPALKASHIGEDVTFTFLPAEGWTVENVRVDGKDKGSIEDFTYRDLAMNARIEVVFAEEMPMQMTFMDVSEGQWFYDDVYFVLSNGLFNGVSEQSFEPNVPMTRGMLVTVLYRLEGAPAITGGSAFTDVAAGQWYTDGVIWATRKGVVNGYGDGRFGPNDPITREQMAAILFRFAQNKGYNMTARADLMTFADGSAVSSYAMDAISWANTNGLIGGRTETTLVPGGTATRAEVAAILYRFLLNIVK